MAVVAAGCGAVAHISKPGDVAHGKALFQMQTLPGGGPGCGTCHTLADAGTHGTVGPNLDDAFAAAKQPRFRSSGTESTIRDLVRGQIAYAERDPGTGATGMPPDLLHGQNAVDVATYVAKCADVPHCNVG